MFGIALSTPRVLVRCATALLQSGGLITLLRCPMPDAVYRLPA